MAGSPPPGSRVLSAWLGRSSGEVRRSRRRQLHPGRVCFIRASPRARSRNAPGPLLLQPASPLRGAGAGAASLPARGTRSRADHEVPGSTRRGPRRERPRRALPVPTSRCRVRVHSRLHSRPVSQACRGAECDLEEKRGDHRQRASQLWETAHHQRPDVLGHRGVRLRGGAGGGASARASAQAFLSIIGNARPGGVAGAGGGGAGGWVWDGRGRGPAARRWSGNPIAAPHSTNSVF